MMITALWVLEQEDAWLRRNFTPADSENDPRLLIIGGAAAAAQTGVISVFPYYQIYRAGAKFEWVADDLAYSAKHPVVSKFWPRTIHNYAPKLLKFGRKGGARKLAVYLGARSIPYVGYALFAWDLWNVGKWIGEKTS